MNMALTKPEVLQGLIDAADVRIAQQNDLLPETKGEEDRKREDLQKLTALKSGLLEGMTRLTF